MSFLSAPLRPLASPLLHGLLPRIDHRIEESSRPFDRPELLRPHVDSRLWAATHYGVFIPQLPEPLRYLNTMTLIGAAGAVVFDNDYLARPDARRTTTVLSSTAAPGHHHYRAYDSHCDCNFGDDGTLLAWSDDLIIEADHPVYRLTARYENFGADLTVTATDQVSWFIRSPVYDHLSLLATFSGSVDGTEVAGLCTVEYARFMSPQSLSAKPLPEPLKLPIDFFTYQIINIDDRTQLLLTDVRAAGVTACRLAHVRSLDGTATVYDDVTADVTEYEPVPAVDPQGRKMRLPKQFRWTIRDNGRVLARITAGADSTPRYGHGRGYVGAYRYIGEFDGRPLTGTGYYEWIDCEPR